MNTNGTAKAAAKNATQTGPLPWTFRTLADAYSPRPPVRYVVASLFMVPSVNIVYGAPGSLKSMLLADLAACVVSGRPWLAPAPGTSTMPGLATTAGPVTWVDLDNGERRTDDRFMAVGKAYNLPDSAPLRYISMPQGGLQIDDDKQAERLAQTLVLLGASLLILDNLSTVKGEADELKDMTKPMQNLRWVATWANVCILAIHHQRKSNGTKGREGETIRGHSSIEANCDVALLVDRGDTQSLAIDVRATKARGATFEERGATFAYTWQPGTRELETARFFGVTASNRNNPKAQEAAEIEDAILGTLQTGPANMSQLATATAYSRNKLRPVLDKLIAKGMVNEQPGKTTNERVFVV